MVNVEWTRNVLDAAARSGVVRRLVYTSTINVLGTPAPRRKAGDPAVSALREMPDPYSSEPRVHSFSSSAELLGFADAIHEHRESAHWVRRIRIGYHDSKLAAQ